MLVKKRIENMKYNAKYATAFKLGMMFNKDIAPNAEPIAMSVKNQDDILCAIKKAYLDMSPRTLQNNDSLSQNHEINKNGKEELFKSLAERFSVYMEKGADDFDEWHYKTCEFFREEFKNLLKKANKDPSGSTYGKAQKIVNMTFKYMYCFDDAYTDENIIKFEPCHMALDSNILFWFFCWYKQIWDDENANRKLTLYGKYQLPPWSELKYEKEENDIFPQYKEIQSKIINRLGTTPRIEAEFVIWYESKKYRNSKDQNIHFTY